MSQQGTSTASEQASRINRIALINVDAEFTIPVRVLDAKTAWGTRYLVTPVNGTGEQWVTEARLRFPEPVEAALLGDGIEDAEIIS